MLEAKQEVREIISQIEKKKKLSIHTYVSELFIYFPRVTHVKTRGVKSVIE